MSVDGMHADLASPSCNYFGHKSDVDDDVEVDVDGMHADLAREVVIISAINQNGQCHLLGTGENGAIQTFHRSQLPKLRFTTSKHFLSPRHTVVAITDFSSTGRPVNKYSLTSPRQPLTNFKKNTVVCIVLNNGTEPFSF